MFSALYVPLYKGWAVKDDDTNQVVQVGDERQANRIVRELKSGKLLCQGCTKPSIVCVRCIQERL